MGQLQLQALLEALVPEATVAFQPPSNVTLVYPAIVYHQDDENTIHADNVPYRRYKRWQITVIDRKPDSDIPDKINDLPMCSFNRAFPANNLNHTVFNLYF